MEPERDSLRRWREELQQRHQARESSGNQKGAEAGQEEKVEDGEERRDKNDNLEKSKTDSDSESEAQFREALRKERSRKRKKQFSVNGGGDPGVTVAADIPVDVLRRISPLCEHMGLTMRQQLGMTIGFVELCGEFRHILFEEWTALSFLGKQVL